MELDINIINKRFLCGSQMIDVLIALGENCGVLHVDDDSDYRKLFCSKGNVWVA